MNIIFDDFFARLRKATGITTQMGLATTLKIDRSAITQAKKRNAVPTKWILQLARHYSLSPDWLEFGTGTPYEKKPLAQQEAYGGTIVSIPKIAATISAGGGSFETAAIPVSTHPFPEQWLSRMGNPKSMVFMDVVGDSMEPYIYDGDMVLIDQSGTQLSPHYVFAVGVEDTLYIKRVEQRNGCIILHSDNKNYSDIEIFGDELDSFRVLGKVIWLSRDCR